MSDKVFLDIVNMSITGSFAILIIMLARFIKLLYNFNCNNNSINTNFKYK